MLTFDQIKELIDIVCQKGLQGLEVERSDFRLRIDGQVSSVNIPATGGEAPTAIEPVSEQTELPEATVGSSDSQVAPVAENGAHTITSPIVGTFYSAPSPEADPYIQVGDEVKSGQVLCIVEAMKLMNEIESDIDGVVVEVFGRNSQPVEFGEPLFAIRPS
jgi:acetyl-CoA carboxylase biotin carboxyl carrier protein